MHKKPIFFARTGRVKPALAGLLVGLLVLAGALASNPSLHLKFHGDTATGTHECVVCLFGQGLVTPVVASPFLILPASSLPDLELLTQTPILITTDYRLSPSRAPPFVSASKTVVG